jgi:hypothetical protein
MFSLLFSVQQYIIFHFPCSRYNPQGKADGV